MIDLPIKDKRGNSYLSYSAISLFLSDKQAFYRSYILKEPFTNKYIEFGSKVGKALETLDFTGFESSEIETLKKVTRLDIFERRTILRYEDFYVIGFVDTCKNDLSEIIDYKTGGKDKEFQYQNSDYTQLHYYALSIRQETGITPKYASVEFIRRFGNMYKNIPLSVANEPPIVIEVDISEIRLKKVYWETIKIAKDIEKYYLYMKNNGRR